ncbi:uncharacterized protein LOC121188339 isoform X2 [Toxotes jaculatrix]|uniref:uncharacterized protein LOC121188339 isoform X2 n=2 Tax=Toxotes jaculatrix TaxID=941984 RepID=UPI001B3A811D|nr:uncharacterized protein LOC121188339 isoform X2 [Toxotes jaculatrix]
MVHLVRLPFQISVQLLMLYSLVLLKMLQQVDVRCPVRCPHSSRQVRVNRSLSQSETRRQIHCMKGPAVSVEILMCLYGRQMLMELLQRDEQHLTTEESVCRPPTSTPLPVWRSQLQVEQVTGELNLQKDLSHLNVSEAADTQSPGPNSDPGSDSGGLTPDVSDIISLRLAGGGASNPSAPSPGLPVRPFLKTRDDFFLPSSHPGVRGRRIPCSLPCSPLLGGRCFRSSPSSPSPPSALSRLQVEAALQRSKNIRQNKLNPPAPSSPQVREGAVWEEGEEEDSDLWCLDSVSSRYCQLTPCICFRCPSAPPYEAEVFSPGDIHTVPSFSSEDQRCSRRLTQLSQRTEVQRTRGDSEQDLPRDSSCLYPSLSLWRITGDAQTEPSRTQEINSYDSQVNDNNTDDHLRQIISDKPGDPQCSSDLSYIMKKVLNLTTCSRDTACPVESCSFCSDTVSVIKRRRTNCDQETPTSHLTPENRKHHQCLCLSTIVNLI